MLPTIHKYIKEANADMAGSGIGEMAIFGRT